MGLSLGEGMALKRLAIENSSSSVRDDHDCSTCVSPLFRKRSRKIALSGDVSGGDVMIWHRGQTQYPGYSKFDIDRI
jgi:hypothetical protein